MSSLKSQALPQGQQSQVCLTSLRRAACHSHKDPYLVHPLSHQHGCLRSQLEDENYLSAAGDMEGGGPRMHRHQADACSMFSGTVNDIQIAALLAAPA